MVNSRSRLGAAVLALAFAGCEDSSSGRSADGELGNGRFTYDCLSTADAHCRGTSVATGLPEAVATGAPFGLSYAGFDDDNGSVLPGANFVAAGTRGFAVPAQGYGVAKVLSADSEILDFVHMLARDVDSIAIDVNGQWSTEATIYGEESISVIAVPFNGALELGGALEYTAESSDSQIVAVVDVRGAEVALRGVAEGRATVVFQAAGVPAMLEVTVRDPAEGTTSTGSGSAGDIGNGDTEGDTDTEGNS